MSDCDHPPLEQYEQPGHAYVWCLKCGGAKSTEPGHEDDEWEYPGDGKNVYFKDRS